MNLKRIHFAEATRLLIIILPLVALAIATDFSSLWVLTTFVAFFVGCCDLGLGPNNTYRVALPLVLIVWMAVLTAYISTNLIVIFFFLMVWSIVAATSYGMHPLDGLAPAMSFILYFILVAGRLLVEMPPLEVIIATLIGTAWSLLVVFGSAFLIKRKKEPMQLPQKRHITTIIKENFTFRSRYFRFAIVRGMALAIGLATYLLAQDRNALWISVTIIVIMIPEERILWRKLGQRILGTVAGVVFIMVFFQFFSSDLSILLTILVSLFLIRALRDLDYSISAFFTTITVLSLGAFSTGDLSSFGSMRIIDTLIGGLIAIAMSYCFIFIERVKPEAPKAAQGV